MIPISIRDFPTVVEKAKVVESLKNSRRLAKPQVGGPSQSDNLVRGICSILGTQLSVLFDFGATHSFISFDCAKKLKLPVRELEIELVVSTPKEGIIVTSSMCAECLVIIDGWRYKISMICIPLKDLEVILGMDWLYANHILVDCGRKKLIFPGLEGMQVISAHQFEREIQEGAECFMLLACSIVTDKVQKDIFVVQEFMDIFPDEIPGLPPKREIEFATVSYTHLTLPTNREV